jgi:predicted regulator of Ras-like GTPase activity (Roadblock/LC7/MglB family)
MADVSHVVTALQEALSGLTTADDAAAQARQRAQQIRARAAQSGFLGVAAGMSAVIQRLMRIHEIHGGAAVPTSGLVESAQRVPVGSDPEAVASALASVMRETVTATSTMNMLAAEVESAKSDVEATLRGGKPGRLLAALDEIARAHRSVISALRNAHRRAEETVAAVRQTGHFHLGAAVTLGRCPLWSEPARQRRSLQESVMRSVSVAIQPAT